MQMCVQMWLLQVPKGDGLVWQNPGFLWSILLNQVDELSVLSCFKSSHQELEIQDHAEHWHYYLDFDQADLLIFRRLGLHVCLPEAASLVLSISPAKLIMLLRGR